MAVKTRRAATTRSSTARLPAKQPGIAAFTRVGKAGARTVSTKDTLSLKRKLEESDERDSDPVQVCPSVEDEKPAKRSKTEDTSTLQQENIITASPSNDTSKQIAAESSASSDSGDSSSQRPTEFSDLIDLNSAFLGALSLHFAHNGALAPANLRELIQSTERIWKKRKVAPQDVRRILHVQGIRRPSSSTKSAPSRPLTEFKLTSYGTNTFLEKLEHSTSGAPTSTSPLKDTELKAEFLANLEYYWDSNVKKEGDEESSRNLLENIPLAPIHPSKGSIKPVGSGGQRTIDQLFGVIKSKPILTREPYAKKPALLKDSVSTSNRRNGLLERMKVKALHQSKLPPPPSKEVMLKRTAVSRMPEVISVLLLLSLPGSKVDDITGTSASLRKSYTMDLITQKIEDSMRTPASRQEIETCIDILGQSSVAKEWVTIVTTSQMKSVVLRSDRRPSPAEIKNESMNLKF
ncbi:DNA mismatch repair protein msh-2 [Arthroderma uncinatum]|uniref:DNA mismatch repair protein msh-2 n=1 Tax=Arthroderma uncinatum TaxID=74035 RepID=UPI00144AA403|nr:DNA mismatch repair protein msh-2 [Arthroderma uncinatum]KAF3490960.1 DNA mismatch repair protein msh-2 [Arthroderma uncinatum]